MTTGLEHWVGKLAQLEDATKIQEHCAVHVFLSYCFRRASIRATGIRNEDVQTTERISANGERVHEIRLLRHITFDANASPAESFYLVNYALHGAICIPGAN